MATGGSPARGAPELDSAQRDEIRGQLAKLLATAAFASSLRRGQLLRYLVERTLADGGDSINEYAIGLDVFQKPASFDPRLESIVRNEAGRLRQKLKDYYAEQGRQDRVLIELPPRGYKPAIAFREAEATPTPDHPTGITRMSRPRRPLGLPLSGLLVAGAVAVVFVYTAAATSAVLLLVKLVTPLRIDLRAELEGLDRQVHGGEAYRGGRGAGGRGESVILLRSERVHGS